MLSELREIWVQAEIGLQKKMGTEKFREGDTTFSAVPPTPKLLLVNFVIIPTFPPFLSDTTFWIAPSQCLVASYFLLVAKNIHDFM